MRACAAFPPHEKLCWQKEVAWDRGPAQTGADVTVSPEYICTGVFLTAVCLRRACVTGKGCLVQGAERLVFASFYYIFVWMHANLQ